jgi:hypothetical protein
MKALNANWTVVYQFCLSLNNDLFIRHWSISALQDLDMCHIIIELLMYVTSNVCIQILFIRALQSPCQCRLSP